MLCDIWLPIGYEMSDESKIKELLFSELNFQIYDTTGSNKAIIVRSYLADKWLKSGFIDKNLFNKFIFGSENFYVLYSNKKYVTEPVQKMEPPKSLSDAIAFAVSLKESRRFNDNESLHDAIYIEQHSRLLPAMTETPKVDDKNVLGTFLTGGVGISVDAIERIIQLTGWLSLDDINEIIEASGLNNYDHATSNIQKVTLTKPSDNVSLNKSHKDSIKNNENI
jgi:hypothetical protein